MAKQGRERVLQARDGSGIYLRHWPSTGSAAIVVAHGNGSHSGVYGRMASFLTGADVYAFDLRGYGASPVMPAEVTTWEGWADDMATVAAEAASAGKKVFLFGHSLGSLVALVAAPRVSGLAGVILSGPSPSSKAITPEWIQGALALLQQSGPTAELHLPWGPEQLVRSEAERAEIARDPLALRPVTTGMMVHIVAMAGAAEKAGPSITVPSLLLLPGDDLLVERSESLRMFGWLGSETRETVEFPGCYHELPQEVPEEVAAAIDRWLGQVLL